MCLCQTGHYQLQTERYDNLQTATEEIQMGCDCFGNTKQQRQKNGTGLLFGQVDFLHVEGMEKKMKNEKKYGICLRYHWRSFAITVIAVL